jgi:hypothetical protein
MDNHIKLQIDWLMPLPSFVIFIEKKKKKSGNFLEVIVEGE